MVLLIVLLGRRFADESPACRAQSPGASGQPVESEQVVSLVVKAEARLAASPIQDVLTARYGEWRGGFGFDRRLGLLLLTAATSKDHQEKRCFPELGFGVCQRSFGDQAARRLRCF